MNQRDKLKHNYHLKKIQPFKFQSKKTVNNQIEPYRKRQKVSTISTIQKKSILSYLKSQQETINQQHINQKLMHAQSGLKIKSPISRKNIFNRGNSEPKKKINIQSRGKSLKYWKQKQMQQPKFVTTIKKFFKDITSNENGCKCGINCQVTHNLIKWINVPEELIRKNYNELINRVILHSKFKLRQSQTQYSEYLQQQSQSMYKQRQKIFNQIKKDIVRTQTTQIAFKNPNILKKGQRILMCYSIQDPQVGYVQGMNMIMSGFLYHIQDQAKTYAVIRQFFHKIRKNYLQDFRMCNIHVNQCIKLLKLYVLDLSQHFQNIGVDLNIILFSWILSLLSSIIPLDYLHLIYLGFIQKGQWIFIYKMIVAIFVYNKQKLKQINDQSDILVYFSATNQQRKSVSDWQDIYEYAIRIKL